MAVRVRESDRSPTCQSPVPADMTEMSDSHPALLTMSRNTVSAMGERQMLPVHTKQIRKSAESSSGRSKLMPLIVSQFSARRSSGFLPRRRMPRLSPARTPRHSSPPFPRQARGTPTTGRTPVDQILELQRNAIAHELHR